MIQKVAIYLSVFALAFLILFISVLRTAAVKYDFASRTSQNTSNISADNAIDYQLPYAGKILPDSSLWPLKALRDKIWLAVTTNPSRKAELKLLFADKRLVSSKMLFDKGKPEIAFSVLTKAEKYLEEANIQAGVNEKNGSDTIDFITRLANASLKHYQVMEGLLEGAPEDAKPKIIEAQSYAKKVYEETRNKLNEKGVSPPENPYKW
ncbi:hypothetical protein A2955_05135 [Candidatus Woesebacteria bacterium RIFCSPLOWO2_01_FULL_37_19]|uniref:DUF5667 domain-containing protein n=2 Tax=Candidatus Woeseibacteriota TaxID=1752722 RepID=A0A1F8B6W5_9BACT|nr:MAG: hypothetical protein A2771_01670 [Candidatus Woesebacteria bacterium RIFCSPHIGHO2_01_FULL_38_26b]OGM59680.1 MAG: hypothetical protein A2955_05135 [Candidatus Woesebacteria bacterium RIFCSPLOWO2_01_FULL_37_19]